MNDNQDYDEIGRRLRQQGREARALLREALAIVEVRPTKRQGLISSVLGYTKPVKIKAFDRAEAAIREAIWELTPLDEQEAIAKANEDKPYPGRPAPTNRPPTI